ncbi:hypothetical protein ACWA1F_11990 [Flavobacterium sp. 3-218]
MKELLKKMHYYLFVRQSKWNIVILLIPIVVFFSYKINRHNSVKQGNYAIGRVTKIYWPLISYKKLYYEYNFKNIKYDGMDIYNRGKGVEENKRYLVRFSLKDPKESDIFQDIEVPDSIKEAPKEGWKELPEWAKNKK